MTIIEEIVAERKRQIEVEGWSSEHDDQHTDGSLADAAACYTAHNMRFRTEVETFDSSGGRGDCPVWSTRKVKVPALWPFSWALHWWKPRERRRDLIRAGALIIAEIDRLDRKVKR